ncbi:MAG: Nif3-like dinuclear metal center hexameric protein [Candidatus Woesearchaeota archaeon]
MAKLPDLQNKLDFFFEIKKLVKDPSMSAKIPKIYEEAGIDCTKYFETDFMQRTNGLMIKGAENVENVFASVFPAPEVMDRFLNESHPGDLLFLHHPLFSISGNLKGKPGKGFIPIPEPTLRKIKGKQLSVYTCHAPLDYNKEVSTSLAMVRALNGKVAASFCPYGNGDAGLVCDVKPITTQQLIEKCKEIYQIPYVDFFGPVNNNITKIACIGGSGLMTEWMQEAEQLGAQAYVTGDVTSHYTNDYGKELAEKVEDYAKTTKMSLIGVSHAASEFLVIKTQLNNWFEETLGINIIPIPLSDWWQ